VRLAYVTTYDAADPTVWSGLGLHIGKAIEAQAIEVHYIGPLEDRADRALSIQRLLARARGKRVLREREPVVVRGYAEQVEEELAGVEVDWVFSPGTIPIAELGGTTPVAFWTDATFAQMVGLYPEFQRLTTAAIENGNRLERLALSRASVAIYASEWAAESAVRDYGADPVKVKVIPFGANLPATRTDAEIDRLIANRRGDLCRLLFVGVDWKRKGGDVALRITKSLNDRGIRAELTIVGATPEIPEKMKDLVNVVGFVSKATEEGRESLQQLFAASHFLVMPSTAECFGVVFAEAAAFGVPSIATNVGGITAVVRDGVNGFTFRSASIVEDATDRIAELWGDARRYDGLCRSAFEDARTRLTWEASGRKVARLLAEMHPSYTLLLDTPTEAKPEGGRRTRGTRKIGLVSKPLISVVTVVRNAAPQIEQTMQAVFAQSYPNVEYIVIDGGSTDGTLDIIRQYDDRIDYWISESDAGIYDAMNKAVSLVSDPDSYILFANAGDRLATSFALEKAIYFGGGADLIYGKMRLTDGNVEGIQGREVDSNDLARQTLCHPATLMRRRIFDEVGRFDTSFRIAADYDLIVRAFQHPVTTKFVDEIIAEMRMGGVSEEQFMLSCSERKRVVRERFEMPARLAGVWQVNLYDIPRNAARQWLRRAGLLRHWRALKRS